jgi:hypothetical protein
MPLNPRNDEADTKDGDDRADQDGLLANSLLDDGDRNTSRNKADTGDDEAESERLNGNFSTRREGRRL